MRINSRTIEAARKAWDATCASGEAGPDHQNAWAAALYAARAESTLETTKAEIDHSEIMTAATGRAARRIQDQISRMEGNR